MDHLFIVLIAIVILLLSRMAYPDIIRFKLSSFLKFASILTFLSLYRIYGLVLNPSYTAPDFFNNTNLMRLATVFWEDVFFVLPSLILFKEGVKDWIVKSHILLVSIIFASLHLYQGTTWAFITLFYVPLNFYFGKRVGILTTAACHVLYDVSTYLTIMLWFYLK